VATTDDDGVVFRRHGPEYIDAPLSNRPLTRDDPRSTFALRLRPGAKHAKEG
jgi:hypothetical protein